MIDNVHDHRLLNKLKKYLFAHPNIMLQLKATAYCGSRIIRQPGNIPLVYVLKNKADAKVYGMATCKNSWFCPTCSVKQMSKYAATIACAIDALKQPKYNQWAFMITFTVPHTSGMSCEETTEILYNTWKDFITHGNKNQHVKYYAKEKLFSREGDYVLKVSKRKLNDPFSSFCETFNCKHRVRVGEFTYGKHGWHPHFHCLFWVDAKDFDLVKGWQDSLNERWLSLAKKHTLKIWNKKFPDKKSENATRLQIMYDRMNIEESKGCYISTDEHGKVIRQESSMYICGWGADKELTGNYQNKATAEGHYTPLQLLEQADDTNNYMELFIEYALATRRKKHCRINWSARSGIHEIIAQWKLTQTYQEVLKKKYTQAQENVGKWEIIYWFNEKQWRQICFYETTTNLLTKILEATRASPTRKEAQDQIEKLLIENCIEIDSQRLNKYAEKQARFLQNEVLKSA